MRKGISALLLLVFMALYFPGVSLSQDQTFIADFDGQIDDPFFLLNVDSSAFSLTDRPGWLKVTTGLNVDGKGRPRKGPNALRLFLNVDSAVGLNFEAEFKIEADFTEPGQVVNLKFGPAGGQQDLVLLYGMLDDTATVPKVRFGAGGLFKDVAVPGIGPVVKFRMVRQGAPYDYQNQEFGDVGPWVMGQRIGYINRAKFQYADGDAGEWVTLGEQIEWVGEKPYYANTFAAASFLANGAPDPFTPIDVYWDYIHIQPLDEVEDFDTWYAAEFTGIFGEPYFLRQEDSTKVSLDARPGWLRVTTDYNADGSGRERKGPNAGRLSLRPMNNLIPIPLPIKVESKIDMTPTEPGQIYILSYGDQQIRYGLIGEGATVPSVMAGDNGDPDLGRSQNMQSVAVPGIGSEVRLRIMQSGPIAIYQYADGDSGDWVTVHQVDGIPEDSVMLSNFAAANYMAYGAPYPCTPVDVDIDYVRHTVADEEEFEELSQYLIADFDGEIEAPFFLLNVDSSAFSLTDRPGWLKVTTGLNVDGRGRPRKGPNAIRLMLSKDKAAPLNFEAEFKIEATFTEPGQVVNLKFGPFGGPGQSDLVLLYGMLSDTATVPSIRFGAGGMFREEAVPGIGPVVKFRMVRQGAPYDYQNQEFGDVGSWVMSGRLGYINRAKFQYADGDNGEWVTLGEQMEWVGDHAYYANTFAAASFLANGAPDPFTPIDVYWDYIHIQPLNAVEDFDTWYAAEFNSIFAEPYFLRQEDSTKVSLDARPGWLRVTTDYNADGSGRERKGPNAGRLSLRPMNNLVPIPLPIKVESKIDMTPTEPGQMYILSHGDQQIRYGLIGEGATVPSVMAGDNGDPDLGRSQNMQSVAVPGIGSEVRLRIMQSGPIAIYQYADGDSGDWVTVNQVGGLPEGDVMLSNFAAANYMAYGAPFPCTPVDVDIDYVRHTVADEEEFEEFSQYLIADFDGEIEAPFFLLNVDSSAFSLTDRPGWLKVTTGLNVDGRGRPRKGPNAIRLMLSEDKAAPLNFEAEFKIEATFTEPGQVVNLKFGPFGGPGQSDLVLLYGMLSDTATVPSIRFGAGGMFREEAVPGIGPVVKFRMVRQGAPYDYQNQEFGDVGPWVMSGRLGYINRAKFQYANGDAGEWVTLGEQMEWVGDHAYYANTFAAASFLANGAPDPFTPIDVYWDYIHIKPLDTVESFDTWYAAEFNSIFAEPFFLRQEDSTKVSLEARPGWLRVTTDYNADGSGRPRKGPNAGRLSLRPMNGLVPMALPLKAEAKVEMTPSEPGQMFIFSFADLQIRFGLIGDTATVPSVMAGDNLVGDFKSVEVPNIGSVVRLRIMQQDSTGIFQYADGDTGSWINVYKVHHAPADSVMFANFSAANYMAFGAPFPNTPLDVDIDYLRFNVAEEEDIQTFVVTDKNIPLKYDLSQNYPNPFNPETAIQYQIPKRSNVKLEIFNVLGQRVRILVDKKQSAGRFTINWDGSDGQGVMVSSGIYIYLLRAGDFRMTKRMVFLK